MWFEVVEPGEAPRHVVTPREPAGRGLFFAILAAFYVLVAAVALFLVRRNLRGGRGDRRGAWRLAVLVFALRFAVWLLGAHHAAEPAELGRVTHAVGEALLFAAALWLGYLGLEPLVRRRWPERVVSWSRVLAGRVADPLVGRDLLLGLACGLGMGLANELSAWAQMQAAGLPRPLLTTWVVPLEGTAGLLIGLGQAVVASLVVATASMVFVALLYAVLRGPWRALLAWWLLFAGVLLLQTVAWSGWVVLPVVVASGLWAVAVARVGLLGAFSAHLALFLTFLFPWSLDAGAWSAPAAVTPMATLAGLALFGAFAAVGGRTAVNRWLAAASPP